MTPDERVTELLVADDRVAEAAVIGVPEELRAEQVRAGS